MSLEDYNLQLEKQDYCCYICKSYNNDKSLCVDHDHKTGKVRKLLCNNCNSALGYVKDRTDILNSMIDYLTEHSEEEED